MGQGSINMPNQGQSGINGILAALSAVHLYYGINTEKQKNELQQYQLASEKRLNDPNSLETQKARAENSATVQFAAKNLGVSPEKTKEMQDIGAKMTASSLASDPEKNNFFNMTKSKLSADASAIRMQPFADRNAVQISKDYESAMKPFRQTQEDVSRIESILSTKDKNGKPIVSSQQLGDANAAMARIFSPNHMSDATVSRTEYESYPAKFAAAVQKLTTTPQDAGSRDLVDHIINQAHHIANVGNKNALQELDTLDAGYQTMQNPAALAMASSKSNAFRKRFGSAYQEAGMGLAQGGSPFPGSNAQAAPKPPTVIQNGHTYQLNPKTGEYE